MKVRNTSLRPGTFAGSEGGSKRPANRNSLSALEFLTTWKTFGPPFSLAADTARQAYPRTMMRKTEL
jgi:hypothetical protein